MAKVINPTGGGSGGYFPSLFVKNIESRCSVYLTNGTRGYNGVWTDRGMTRLPSAYQEVDYIESSGTQYIDTGIIPSNDFKIELSLALLTNGGIYGARGSSTSATPYFYFATSSSNELKGYYGTTQTSIATISLGTKYSLIADINSITTTYKLNDTIVTASTSGSIPLYSIYLFGYHYEYSGNNLTSQKLYSTKITQSGTLVRDYIPCYRKSDDVIGLYDLVNGVFYENQGTGDFTKGKDVNYYGFYFPKIKDLGTYTLGCLDRLEQTIFEETIEITEPIENTFTFPHYLYKDGAELNVRTGGWETRAFTNSSSAKRYGICTASQVNLNAYRKLCIEYVPLQIGSSTNRLGYLGYSDTQLSSWTDIPAERNIIPVSTRETISHYEIDISNVMDWKYISIYDGVISSWNTPTLNKLSHAIQVIMYYNDANKYNVAHLKIWLE